MKCPRCDAATMVEETRKPRDEAMVRRRRQCKQCKHRFTTYEIAADRFDALRDLRARIEADVAAVFDNLVPPLHQKEEDN